MTTPPIPYGISIGLDSAEVVAPAEPYYVVENHDVVSAEAGDNGDDTPKKNNKHVDLPKTAASDYSTKA